MLETPERDYLRQLVGKLDPQRQLWLAGYVQGLVDANNGLSTGVSAGKQVKNLSIYFATETGNSKKVAQGLEKAAKNAGFKTKLQAFNRAQPQKFKEEGTLIFVTSTQGEGEYPDAAKPLVEKLNALPAQALNGLHYAVIGLGDSAYSQFCGAALKLDALLTEKGATVLLATVTLNVDYAQHLDGVYSQVLAKAAQDQTAASEAGYSRLSPVKGVIKEIVNLNDVGSDRETYHIEIGFDANISYQPGDALGVILPPQADGSTPVPRLYSIASALSAAPDEVHLTVARSTYQQADGSIGYGLCSNYLAQLQADDEIQFFIHRNDNFRLPEDDSAEVIMLGAGTGVAPFRAFIQERAARDASGKNRLIFGNPHAHYDFLYQAEWQDYLDSGILSEIHLAFSRDQAEKIYVQHKVAALGADLIHALDNGAYFYVCGAKQPMSHDVEQSLIALLVQHKGLSVEAASDYLNDLSDAGRYLKDVY